MSARAPGRARVQPSHSPQPPGHNPDRRDGIIGLRNAAGRPADLRHRRKGQSAITSLQGRLVDTVNFRALSGRVDVGVPLSYITAFRARRSPVLTRRCCANSPNVTLSTRQHAGRVEQVLGQVIRAVEALFGFTPLAGLDVLVRRAIGPRAASGEREREFRIPAHAAGARSVCCAVQRAELPGAGLLSGLLASVGGRGRLGAGAPGVRADWPDALCHWPAYLRRAVSWRAGWGLRGVLRRAGWRRRRAAD